MGIITKQQTTKEVLEEIRVEVNKAQGVIEADENLKEIFADTPGIEIYKIIQDQKNKKKQERRALIHTLRQWLWIIALLAGAVMYIFQKTYPLFDNSH